MIYYSSFGTKEVKDFISDKDYMGAIITPSRLSVRDDWDVIADNGLWETSVKIENVLNTRRKNMGKDEVFMFKPGILLENMFDNEFEQLDIFGNSVVLNSEEETFNDGKCDEGHCWI